MNTWFRKRNEKLVTFRVPGTEITDEIEPGKHEQLDYFLAQDRWKNSVKNVESDTKANIVSDHFPLKIRLIVKLRAEDGRRMQKRKREKYKICGEPEEKKVNEEFFSELTGGSADGGSGGRGERLIGALKKSPATEPCSANT